MSSGTGRGRSGLRRAGTLLVAAGALAPALAFAGTRVLGEEVRLLARVHGAVEREEARRLHDPRDDVAWIYGVLEPGGPVRVMAPDPERRIVPVEDPAQVLYAVDRARGESPLLARTVLWLGGAAGALLLAVGGACLFLGRRKA